MFKKAIGVGVAIVLLLLIFVAGVVINSMITEGKASKGLIVFISSRHSKTTDETPTSSVYTMRADGSRQTRLTEDNASYQNPQWSPDGKQIVVSRNSELYVMEADGLGRLKVAEQGSFAQFSPDGKKVLYVRVVMKKDYFLTIMDADGGNKKELATGYITQMTWSPDGNWIAYVSGKSSPDTKATIRLIKPDGTEDHVFSTGFTDDAHSPSFSPDGKKLVFSSFTGKETGETYVADLATGQAKKLNIPKGSSSWKYVPKWSPDGKHISYLASDVPPWSTLRDRANLVTTESDGKNPKNLTTLKKNEFVSDVSWAEKGEAILFTLTQVKKTSKKTTINVNVCMVTLDGKLTKLTETNADYSALWK